MTMLDSVKLPFDQCIQVLLENIKLDPHFKDFLHWARENNIPVVVLSGGMRPIIEALLTRLVGQDAVIGSGALQIVSNDVTAREGKSINEEGGWKVVFHDER